MRRLKKAIEDLTMQHSATCQKLKQDHEEAIETLRAQFTAQNTFEKAIHKTQLDQISVELHQAQQAITDLTMQHNDTLQKLTNAKQEIKSLKQKHNSELTSRKKEFETDKQKTIDRLTQTSQELQDVHAHVVAGLQDQIRQLTEQNKQSQLELKQALAVQSTRHGQAVKALEDAHVVTETKKAENDKRSQETIDTLKNKVKAIQRARSRLRTQVSKRSAEDETLDTAIAFAMQENQKALQESIGKIENLLKKSILTESECKEILKIYMQLISDEELKNKTSEIKAAFLSKAKCLLNEEKIQESFNICNEFLCKVEFEEPQKKELHQLKTNCLITLIYSIYYEKGFWERGEAIPLKYIELLIQAREYAPDEKAFDIPYAELSILQNRIADGQKLLKNRIDNSTDFECIFMQIIYQYLQFMAYQKNIAVKAPDFLTQLSNLKNALLDYSTHPMYLQNLQMLITLQVLAYQTDSKSFSKALENLKKEFFEIINQSDNQGVSFLFPEYSYDDPHSLKRLLNQIKYTILSHEPRIRLLRIKKYNKSREKKIIYKSAKISLNKADFNHVIICYQVFLENLKFLNSSITFEEQQEWAKLLNIALSQTEIIPEKEKLVTFLAQLPSIDENVSAVLPAPVVTPTAVNN